MNVLDIHRSLVLTLFAGPGLSGIFCGVVEIVEDVQYTTYTTCGGQGLKLQHQDPARNCLEDGKEGLPRAKQPMD